MIDLLQSIIMIALGIGLILNAMTTRRLIKAVEACTQLTVMAILYQQRRLW
jgi:hypothetical protein